MDAYPPIEDHGLIGDLQTCALVSRDGTIDWFCSPRFDSPSLFGSLLDDERGGHFRISPSSAQFTSRQLYLPDTAILITRFMSEEGVGEILDFMPVLGDTASERHSVYRLVRCVRGRMTFDVEVAPRFDYGRREHRTHLHEFGAVFESGEESVTLHVVRDAADAQLALAQLDDEGDIRATLTLSMGELRGVVLEYGSSGPPRMISPAEADEAMAGARRFWAGWLGQCTYRGRWREAVLRSAVTLKLLTYAPSGAIIAAPTAGLPEQVGGERNWDYRYTWVRDGSFSVAALLGLGFRDEAAAFGRWLRDRVEEQAGDSSGPLKIMYRVDGSSELVEESLEHWDGYRGSHPVRIGNGASDQLQLDIYGEALDALFAGDQRGLQFGHDGWLALRRVVDWVAAHWDAPDEGIWETRGGQKDFTYGRLMSWVALDRAIRLATTRGRPAALGWWTAQRDAIYDQIMDRGWSSERQAFRQHYDSDVLDSSLLKMVMVGFVSPTDPRWTSTLAAMEKELVTDSLVYRYDPAATPDGLQGSEGTFSLCTFNYVNALARGGRLDDARLTFEKMLTYANHLGLYAEEIGPSGEQLGNFPQAFTHLALIDAAIALDGALDAAGARREASGGRP
ncbi:GH15 family glucan-1,4-alpha-glucosidase [Humibacillus xanthopallidus]|uniref:GH15 family glucan-1,4-alpha-glucosidase n=1 Tax=Humibacillus xanthopallidus TaxID=412689 RepID=A0A543PYD8_9MICO|nr:GH15 family glucan-1,4-alpha-glucosidase [Humibacillus xanthopallidus]